MKIRAKESANNPEVGLKTEGSHQPVPLTRPSSGASAGGLWGSHFLSAHPDELKAAPFGMVLPNPGPWDLSFVRITLPAGRNINMDGAWHL